MFIYRGEKMRLIRQNSFIMVFLSDFGVSYRIINGKIKITGLYKRVKLGKIFDL